MHIVLIVDLLTFVVVDVAHESREKNNVLGKSKTVAV